MHVTHMLADADTRRLPSRPFSRTKRRSYFATRASTCHVNVIEWFAESESYAPRGSLAGWEMFGGLCAANVPHVWQESRKITFPSKNIKVWIIFDLLRRFQNERGLLFDKFQTFMNIKKPFLISDHKWILSLWNPDLENFDLKQITSFF